jgi:hypothetical protein
MEAATSLGSFGEAALDTVPLLETLLVDENPVAREYAAEAIRKIALGSSN